LNHFTVTSTSGDVGVTADFCRVGGSCEGCVAVLSSIDSTRKACSPFGRSSTSNDDTRALVRRLESVAPQAGDVQQDVRHAVVGTTKPNPLATSNHFMTPDTSIRSTGTSSCAPVSGAVSAVGFAPIIQTPSGPVCLSGLPRFRITKGSFSRFGGR
jgi:hypothetical protein